MQSSADNTTLYVKGQSRVHGLHPLNKLAYVFLSGAVAYLAPGGWLPCVTVLVLNSGLALYAGVAGRAWKLLWRVMLPLAVFMIPIHGFLYPDNQTALAVWHGVAVYREGLQFAGTVLLQLAVLLTASLLFVLCTHPADILTAITQSGLPPALAYLLGSPLLMLPAMKARVGVIQSAQRARGLNSEGNLFQRIKGVVPLVIPFVLGALMDIEQRAVALEVRGFNGGVPKTSWRVVRDSRAQQWFRWLMLAASLGLIGYRAVV
ncbi:MULTISPECIES: energy-coupling factor transporter transmembrane component T [unclassified Pseudodesulfovibrio]|uniref:energy-coupling factor transporter transmembrane component T family protein n=1 Tax=unclassified Pseudodesulfovibrio TaxID=2661612 RepID=UPI000FEC0CA7|nr:MULTISPECIES: energy-coupling factor transporter transmembrane component T [unclassified Pseudodesulfovibrio]MCJ2163331.1 energy-coupling factor transporter transmembrane protein EcfT [Pseudodesulfovibrio sp. S3-i]RWU06571.1 energy-coupling factor transporter transmembrane protein EcfT [Pseudodesulfovibrio sp. S3]